MAEQDIETLVTEFRADIKQYEKELRRQFNVTNSQARKIERRFDKMNKRINRGFSNVAKTFTRTFGGLVGAAGLTLSIRALDQISRAAIESGDSIGKAAKVADISAESLQEYRYAATLAGSSQKELDDAVGRFTRRLGEARRGNAEYAKTFKQLNVDVNDTNEQALEKVFDTLAGVEDVTVRTALATKVFGDDARRMALVVRDGADALREARQEARDMGAVLDNETVGALEEAADKLAILDAQLKTARDQAIADNIDGVLQLATAFNELSVALIKVGGNVGDFIGQFKRFLGLRAGTEIRDLRIQYADLGVELQSVGEKIESNFKQLDSPIAFVAARAQAKLEENTKRATAIEEKRAKILEEIERRQKELANLEKEQEADAEGGGTGGLTLGVDEDEVAKAEKLLDELEGAYNDLFDTEIQGIERVRKERLAALEEVQLSEEDKARERVRINAIADEEIAEKKREQAAEEIALVRDVVDARDRAAGRIIRIAQNEFEAREMKIRREIQDEGRRNEALKALAEERAAFEDDIRRNLPGASRDPRGDEAIVMSIRAETRLELQALQEAYDEKIIQLEEFEARRRNVIAASEEEIRDIRMRTLQFQIGSAASTFGKLADLTRDYAGEQSNIFRGLFAAQKAFSIANAIISTHEAVTKALASAPPPANFVQAGLVAAAGFAEVASITAASFRSGGEVRGPGSPTSDSIPARLSDGEFVVNSRAAQRNLALLKALNSGMDLDDIIPRFQSGGPVAKTIERANILQPSVNVSPAAAAAPNVNVQPPELQASIINVSNFDEAIAAYLSSPEGAKRIVNIAGENPSAFRSAIGG